MRGGTALDEAQLARLAAAPARVRRVRRLLQRKLRELFAVHEETVNVWTHLLGAAVQAGVLWRMARDAREASAAAGGQGGASAAAWPMLAYQAADVGTLMASWTAHLFARGASARTAAVLWRLDHAGVVAGLAAEGVAFAWYALGPAACAAYAVAAPVALLAALRAMLPAGRRLSGHHRAMAALAGARAAALAHGTAALLRLPGGRGPLLLSWGSAAAFGLGAAAYAWRAPERWAPPRLRARLRLLGNSHNVMHVLTLAGMLMASASAHALWRGGLVRFVTAV